MTNNEQLRILVGLFQEAHYDPLLFRSWIGRYKTPQEWAIFRERVTFHPTPKARAIFLLARIFSFDRVSAMPQAIIIAWKFLKLFEWIAMQWYIISARRRLRRSGIRVTIGITGSFGKTTTKEIIAEVLSQRFKAHRTPENVNTFLGVAMWIRRTRFAPDDILIAEMGAYQQGDIAKLCRLIRPTVGILTGINEAHLERFGALERIKAAKSELFDALSPGGRGFWNDDSVLVRQAVSERQQAWLSGGIRLHSYSQSGCGAIHLEMVEAKETALRIRAEKPSTPGWAVETSIQLMGRHHGAPLAVAVAVADALGLTADEIKSGLERVRPLPRRLAPTIGPAGRLTIDDSYNITLDGLRAAIEVLRNIQRRKIGVFAGIPEAGDRASEVNRTLGRLVAPVFDTILLRDTPVREAIEAGLRDAGWNRANLFRYTEKEDMERLLGKVIRPGDCVYLSAYDWPAIYL